MTVTAPSSIEPNSAPLNEYIERLMSGGVLLPESPTNVIEVVGILASYGIVLDAYSINLIYAADNQFLRLFPFFKYFNGEISVEKTAQALGSRSHQLRVRRVLRPYDDVARRRGNGCVSRFS